VIDWLSHHGVCDPPRPLKHAEHVRLDEFIGRWHAIVRAFERTVRVENNGYKGGAGAYDRATCRLDDALEELVYEVETEGLRLHWVRAVLRSAPSVSEDVGT
jgi:hypothetical protein